MAPATARAYRPGMNQQPKLDIDAEAARAAQLARSVLKDRGWTDERIAARLHGGKRKNRNVGAS